jgi:hypothetical protein
MDGTIIDWSIQLRYTRKKIRYILNTGGRDGKIVLSPCYAAIFKPIDLRDLHSSPAETGFGTEAAPLYFLEVERKGG